MNAAPILLVEDNPDDAELTVRALRQHGVGNAIVVAEDAEQALGHLAAEGRRFALVLLDVNLPRVSGLEVLRRLRAQPHTRALPVVVLTTSSEDRDIADAYRLGANSFVRKPVVFAEFLESMRTLGRYWLEVNEPAPEWGGLP